MAFDYKEFRFEPTFYTYDNSEKSLSRVLDVIKRLGILEKGIYKWYPEHYGPVIINQIETSGFVQISSNRFIEQMDDLVDGIHKQYFTREGLPVDRQFIKDKITFSSRLIPFDTTIFFKYNVEIKSLNTGSKKVVEHNLFCYFHSLVGYNQEKFYLMTLFYE